MASILAAVAILLVSTALYRELDRVAQTTQPKTRAPGRARTWARVARPAVR